MAHRETESLHWGGDRECTGDTMHADSISSFKIVCEAERAPVFQEHPHP